MEDNLGGLHRTRIYAVFILSKSQFPQHALHYIHTNIDPTDANIYFLKPKKYLTI